MSCEFRIMSESSQSFCCSFQNQSAFAYQLTIILNTENMKWWMLILNRFRHEISQNLKIVFHVMIDVLNDYWMCIERQKNQIMTYIMKLQNETSVLANFKMHWIKQFFQILKMTLKNSSSFQIFCYLQTAKIWNLRTDYFV